MWNGNEDEEGLKENLEKGETLKCIRMNRDQIVGIQRT